MSSNPLPSDDPESATEQADAKRVDEAIKLIQAGDAPRAERVLREVVARTPTDYRHTFERGDQLCVKFWAMEDFLHYVTTMKQRGGERAVSWVTNAYPRAHYYLAFLRVKAGDPEGAIRLLDKALELEPGVAFPRLEKAKALAMTGQREAAIEWYEQVIEMGDDVPAGHRAVAYRGKGFQMIELGRLDEAEALFKRSLELDPASSVAHNELAYIAQLRAGGPRAPQETVATMGKSPLICAACGTESADGGKVFNYEGRVVCLCKRCVGRLTKKWWQFWK